MGKTDPQRLLNFEQAHDEVTSLRAFRLAVLAPQDLDVLQAVVTARGKGMVEPVLIGSREKILEAGSSMFLDLQEIEIVDIHTPAQMARLGIDMFYRGEVDLVVKGLISTSHIYRSIIAQEKALGSSSRVAVCSFWQLPQQGRFILMTDTGVNITPDWQVKRGILQKAVSVMQLLGYGPLKALALSACREIDEKPSSRADAEKIRDYFQQEKIPCQVEFGGEMRYFPGNKGQEVPDIILVPHLDAGNIVVKLDFFLEIQRASVLATSRGFIIVPSRSDTAGHILDELALGIAITNRLQMQGGNGGW